MRKTDRAGWRLHTLRNSQSAPFRPWLTDRASLTARLRSLGPFSVELLMQRLAKPTRDEAAFLGSNPARHVRVREVTLFCCGRPTVFAHTVLPRRPRGPLTRWFAQLGNRSLGALLFSHPGFRREPLMARKLDRRHPLHARATQALSLTDLAGDLYARRSRFTFGKQNVLVTEVFSPDTPRFCSTPNDHWRRMPAFVVRTHHP